MPFFLGEKCLIAFFPFAEHWNGGGNLSFFLSFYRFFFFIWRSSLCPGNAVGLWHTLNIFDRFRIQIESNQRWIRATKLFRIYLSPAFFEDENIGQIFVLLVWLWWGCNLFANQYFFLVVKELRGALEQRNMRYFNNMMGCLIYNNVFCLFFR